MKEKLDRLLDLLQTPMGRLEVAAVAVTGLCVAVMIGAVVLNFAAFHTRTDIKDRKRSRVATGTMSAFFVGMFLLIHYRIGVVPISVSSLRATALIAGMAFLVAGCALGVAGRLKLGRNWANQVTIYEDQRLVTSGAYRIVRHPLYASLIWMSYGAALVYANLAAVAATTLVFLPMMIARARREEEVLLLEFPEYADYRNRVKMFIPGW